MERLIRRECSDGKISFGEIFKDCSAAEILVGSGEVGTPSGRHSLTQLRSEIINPAASDSDKYASRTRLCVTGNN